MMILKVTCITLVVDPYMKNAQDDPKNNLIMRCENPQSVLVYSTHDTSTVSSPQIQ
jgi:hypothetical protein